MTDHPFLMSSYFCRACQVGGRGLGRRPSCWNCGKEMITVAACGIPTDVQIQRLRGSREFGPDFRRLFIDYVVEPRNA